MPAFRSLLLAATAASAALAAPQGAAAADIAVTKAEVAGGRLVIAGTTSMPGMRVRLEGQSDGDFNTAVDGSRAFAFSVAYMPTDCVVTLQIVMPSFVVGEPNNFLVSGCARGITPRGAWSAAARYTANDLVSRGGASWIAVRDSKGRQPIAGADWQLFSAAPSDGGGGSAAGDDTKVAAGSATPSPDRAPPDGPAGGDLTGTYPNPQIKAGTIVGADIALGTIGNGKLAANSISTDKIVDGQVRAADLGNDSVTSPKIVDGAVNTADVADGAITSAKVLDDTQPGGGLTAADLAGDSVGFSEIQTDAVQATEIADNSIDAGEIVDFGLSNEDVGVLFAQVNADGTIFNNSGGVTGVSLGTGTYEIDFGHDVSNCAGIATQGEGGVGGAGGAIMGVTDRSGNAEAFFITARTNAGALVNTAFQVVAVC